MAEQEEDLSSLPLTDRWVHKVWKHRKAAYEEAAKQFEQTPDEYAPAFRPFLQDSSLFKAAVSDSNVAAQQEGISALCSFLKFGGREGCLRTRSHTITPILEKGLSSTRAATKTSSVEALLLYIELDVPGPIIEDILPILSAKQPKVIAAALSALTTIYHNYGCKTVDPKPVLKALPKVFGHADKNVRAEATNLTVEFYRWLRDAMKPMIWNELKPAQQTDLEAQFEKVRAEPPPKQERLLRSQQAAQARAPAAGGGEAFDDGADEPDAPAEIDAFDLAEPQDVLKALPASFYDNVASSKWKDRKDALEELYALLNIPRIKDGDFNEMTRVFAKCMKDANIAVVTQAAQCIEVLAKGLRKAFGKHRATVMQPILERLKEKKQSVADALGAALDQVFLATGLSECLEDIIAYLVHKNPQVKEGTMKFLVRCLRTTREVPSKEEIGKMVESAKKLLSESSEGLRSGGAEILGTIMKIIGERGMNAHLEGLDDIRKTKIKEFFQTAEVKAKERPKPIIQPKAAPGGAPRKIMGGGVKKGPGGPKKGAPAAAPTPTREEPLAPQPTPRAAPAASKLGMPKPSGLGGLKAPGKRTLAGPGMSSPRRPMSAAPPPMDDEPEVMAPPQPRLGMGRGGLAGRSLAKPAAATARPMTPASPVASSGLTALERAELEELRASNERLTRQVEEFRHERSKFMSEIQELKNQNAGLIEDHTRDVLSIKAKETQLVRARSDAEAAEGTNERLRRELERLKRALGKAEAQAHAAEAGDHHNAHAHPHNNSNNNHNNSVGSPGDSFSSPTHDDAGIYRDGGMHAGGGPNRNRISYTSTMSEEKENGEATYPRSKLSPDLRYANSAASSGRGSPARGYRSRDLVGGGGGVDDGAPPARPGYASGPPGSYAAVPTSSSAAGPPTSGVESWKRAAEVTSQLKARIEQMKAKQGFSRP